MGPNPEQKKGKKPGRPRKYSDGAERMRSWRRENFILKVFRREILLDPDSDLHLERLADQWGLNRSESVRRIVAVEWERRITGNVNGRGR